MNENEKKRQEAEIVSLFEQLSEDARHFFLEFMQTGLEHGLTFEDPEEILNMMLTEGKIDQSKYNEMQTAIVKPWKESR